MPPQSTEYTSTFGAADTHCSAAGWIQHLLQEPLCSENILNTVSAGHHLSHSHKWLLPDQKQKPSSRWQWLMTRPGATCIRVNSLILDFLRASGVYGTQEHKVCFITEQSQCYNVPSSAECAVNSWSQRKSWSRVLYTLCTHYVHWAGVRVGGLCKKYTYSVYTSLMSVHCASH